MRRFLTIALALALATACGTKARDPDAAPMEGDAEAGDPIIESDASMPDAAVTNRCTGDLHGVLDDSGNVILTCPPDRGCANGTCVPACDAAAASKGSIGCDFVIATPSFEMSIKPPCFAVFVANGWEMDAKLAVSRDGVDYDVSAFGRIATVGMPETSWPAVPSTGIPPGKVAVLFLSHDPSSLNGGSLRCPITPAISQTFGSQLPSAGSGYAIAGRGAAWHVTSSFPATAYDILPYGGAKSYLPSAELLYPTTAWGTNYLGIVPIRGSAAPQWGQIVAAQDDTTVTVFPNIALPGGNYGGSVITAPAYQQTKYTLQKGEFIQWQDTYDMSGTILQSNTPFAFHGGQGYACYTSATSSGGGCDSAHQQIPPVSSFGSEYVGIPYTTRMASLKDESIRYRIVGAVKGTQLSFVNLNIGATVNVGQTFDFEAVGPFVVRSQDESHPFYLGEAMSGCMVQDGSRPPGGCLGDEEFVNVLPPAQFLSKYVFFADPSYPTTNLVFVRARTNGVFEDVMLDCAGVLGNWQPIGSSYEITNIDLIRGGTPNGKCNNGPHVASSKGAFGLMVWGLDDVSSYGYPAGGNAHTINPVVLPPK